MDICRLKQVSHVQCCSLSMLIPIYDINDTKSIISVDLLEWMNKKPEFHNSLRHKIYLTFIKNIISFSPLKIVIIRMRGYI